MTTTDVHQSTTRRGTETEADLRLHHVLKILQGMYEKWKWIYDSMCAAKYYLLERPASPDVIDAFTIHMQSKHERSRAVA